MTTFFDMIMKGNPDLDDQKKQMLMTKYKDADQRDFRVRSLIMRDVKDIKPLKRVDPLKDNGRIPHRITSFPREIFDTGTIGIDNDWITEKLMQSSKKMTGRGEVGTKLFETPLINKAEMLKSDGNIGESRGFWQSLVDKIKGR
jgi:hypothetical protein